MRAESQQWAKKPFFFDALKLPPDERAAFLAKACEGDNSLHRLIEALLAAHDPADNFLEQPAAAGAERHGPATVDYVGPPVEKVGARVGPYKLIEPIGEGGMGAVWIAQQTEPVRRLVAVKIIKAGMDSK